MYLIRQLLPPDDSPSISNFSCSHFLTKLPLCLTWIISQGKKWFIEKWSYVHLYLCQRNKQVLIILVRTKPTVIRLLIKYAIYATLNFVFIKYFLNYIAFINMVYIFIMLPKLWVYSCRFVRPSPLFVRLSMFTCIKH